MHGAVAGNLRTGANDTCFHLRSVGGSCERSAELVLVFIPKAGSGNFQGFSSGDGVSETAKLIVQISRVLQHELVEEVTGVRLVSGIGQLRQVCPPESDKTSV